ncbi:MAG: hypothetical protein M3R04_05645, partial [bacterium]|nr:hypothetical protein [bacterium]
GWAERDQLDGDTEAIVVPLPLSTYAHGWVASGEFGYDYRNHPADGSLGYPRDHYYGTESYDALAGSLGLPVALGISQRRSTHIFDPEVGSIEPQWLRLGEGIQWGLHARLFPGIEYGHSEMKHDYDWTVQPDQSYFSSRIKAKRSGFAFHPTGWLTLASDGVKESYIFRDPRAGYGTIHTGDSTVSRSHLGAELNLGNVAVWRWGLYDGRPTVGASLILGGFTFNYAECKDLLPEIIGTGEHWKAVHIYGVEAKPF